jgi:conjugal transfer pilus assembly protein TraV
MKVTTLQSMRSVTTLGSLLLGTALLGGCASSLTGYDAETRFRCAAENNGLPCTPMSDVYKSSLAHQLPGSLQERAAGAANASVGPLTYHAGAQPAGAPTGALFKPQVMEVVKPAQQVAPTSPVARALLDSGMPVRAAPTVLRALIFPWVDANGVFNDQRLIYITLDNGRWLMEANQQAIMDSFAPTRLIQGGPAAAPSATNATGSRNQQPSASTFILPGSATGDKVPGPTTGIGQR